MSIHTGGTVAERLERGEVIFCPQCPFPVPEGKDRSFLLAQELSGGHKNISYAARSGKARGFRRQGIGQAERLGGILAEFAQTATDWLAQLIPTYAAAWQMDQISFRPVEESTRRLRLKARNDLLHVDAFPNRPTNEARILRLFVNVNPTEPRVWITGEPFALLLRRFGAEAAALLNKGESLGQRLGQAALSLVRPARRRSAYDTFMLRFHDFLKANRAFQELSPRTLWAFPPGSAWLALTDTCSHAVLSGRYALEHSYFIAPCSLALPNEAPAELLRRTFERHQPRRAA